MGDFFHHYLQQFSSLDGLTLDVGCGCAPYKDAVRGRYIGVDFTDSPYDSGEKIRIDTVASGCSLPFRDDTFDLVFTRSALLLMPDQMKAIREFLRVLKPAGRVLIADYNRRTQILLRKKDSIKRDYPKWTQWGLLKAVRRAGFNEPRILVPTSKRIGYIERILRIMHQEAFGCWAVVTAIKS